MHRKETKGATRPANDASPHKDRKNRYAQSGEKVAAQAVKLIT